MAAAKSVRRRQKSEAISRSASRPPATPPAPATLLTGFQRRAVFGMFGAGLGYLLVGLLLLPHGALFWLAFALAPPALGGLAALAGGRLGHRLDAWLTGGGSAKPAWSPPAATALPEAARRSLQAASVPVLLGEALRTSGAAPGRLGDALRGAPAAAPRERQAAGRLAEAAITLWNKAADAATRDVLAQSLPRQVVGLAQGTSDAAQAAEAEAARLSRMAGGAA